MYIKKHIERDSTNYESIENRTYGANLHRFLKKARDWRSKKRFAETPKIVMIGDSITGGSWAEDFKTWLCEAYRIAGEDFAIHWYGGYPIQGMLPFIEETLIYPNPDLVIFNEYESPGLTEERKFVIEDVIKIIRDRTTADIAIGTWSMSDTIAAAYLADKTSLINDDQYEWFNWYRDIASIYNCELIDFNEALKNALDSGHSVASLGMSGPHLSTAGYTIVHLPEIKKHFGLSDDQLKQYIPYPLSNKEEWIYLAPAIKNDWLKNTEKLTVSGTGWSTDQISISTANVGDYIEIQMKDIIGFEIQHGDTANADLLLKLSGGSYTAPSTFTNNGKPLQYITEVLPVTNRYDWDNFRFKRPFEKGTLTANELSDGSLRTGRYTIKALTNWSCEMFNPASVSMGTFTIGQTADFVAGNLTFPQKWNGEMNWRGAGDLVVNDIYEFFICNNWCDTLLSQGNERTRMIEPDKIVVQDVDNYATWSKDTGVGRIVQAPGGSDASLQWFNFIIGNTYRLVYNELSRVGTSQLRLQTPSTYFDLNAEYQIIEFIATATLLKIVRKDAGDLDVSFTISCQDITAGGIEQEGTNRVVGLERGDYVLKITATTGGMDLFGINLLHGG